MSPQDERFSILGPMFRYDLIRTSRQGRVIFFRILYAGCLCAILGFWFLGWSAEAALVRRASLQDGSYTPGSLSAPDAARLADAFFGWFIVTQFLVLFLFTPVLVGSIITEEKERHTLTFLLTTHLTDREIICGKLAARLAQLFLLFLTGIPFLCLLQLLGGVDFALVVLTFAGTALFMLSLASLAAYQSARSVRTTEAVMRVYWWGGLYLILVPCIPGLNSGHPTVVWSEWETYRQFGMVPWSLRILGLTGPVAILGPYILFHLVVSGLFCFRAIRELRPNAFKSPAAASLSMARLAPSARDAPTRKSALAARFLPYETLLERWPLFWKEYVFGRNPISDRQALILFYFGIGIYISSILAPSVVVAWLLALVACLWVGGVALRGARTFSLERELQTLDGLLGLPQSTTTLVVSKAAACVLRPSLGMLGFVLIQVFSMVGVGLSALAVPLLLVLGLSFGAFGAALGVLVSVFQTNSLRALIWTASVFIGVQLGAMALGCSIFDGIMGATFGYGTASDHPDLRYDSNWGQGPPLLTFLTAKYTRGLIFVIGYGLATEVMLLVSILRLRAEAGPRPRRELKTQA